MLLEEQDIDDDVCARLLAHGFPRQAHRSEEIGHRIDMLACCGIALVERVSRGDKHGDAAGAQLLDRAGNEVIVEREPHAAERRAVLYGDVRERRIADREIEVAGQRCLVEIDAANELRGIESAGDAGGDGIAAEENIDRLALVQPDAIDRGAAGRGQPSGRFGTAAEFGAVCAFLCSIQAGYLTGQNILLDGGRYPGTF